MVANFRLWEDGHAVSLLAPAADAAGRTSSYISVASGHKAYVVFHINQGNAATALLSVLQATDTSGANSKAISAVPINANLDCSADVWSQSTAASYTTDAALKVKMVMFEIQPSVAMDINNTSIAFTTIAVSTGASHAANITSAYLYIAPLRQAGLNPSL